MSNIAISVENLSKQYRLGQVGTGAIGDDLSRWWAKLRGKDDPFLKVGDTNDRTTKGNSDFVWSLKDINFEIQQGDAVGIIGRNGAGKSTLLKLLSKVTQPTTGIIKTKGRIASLLEVGTGFHPELSGRENIFLNGAILGMSKSEIKRKFDEIVDFSGVERYIDTPVKRYSSGMYVRLAFAVAAHLESEILIVDEVLAVGDAEFQKKCLGKMGEVSSGEGRTVLFVSHNMAAVKALCNKSILLNKGLVEYSGNTNAVITEYFNKAPVISSGNDLLNDYQSRRGNGEVRFTEVMINDGGYKQDPQEDIVIKMKCKILKPIEELYLSILLKNSDSTDSVTNTGLINLDVRNEVVNNELSFNVKIPANTLRTGLFPLYIWLGKKAQLAEDNYPYDLLDSVYYLNISSDKSMIELGYNSEHPNGCFNLNYNFEIK